MRMKLIGPSEKKLIQGFDQFEQGFNTLMSLVRSNSPGVSLADDTEGATITPKHAEQAMWQAHEVYRRIAIAAQYRLDAKEKGGKDRDTVQEDAGSSGSEAEGEQHGKS